MEENKEVSTEIQGNSAATEETNVNSGEVSAESKKRLTPKTKKIINIVVDVFCGIILVFALIIAISTITSRAKGYDQYTEIFGRAYLAVQSDSMKEDYNTHEVKSDNFSAGDLIVIKTLKESEVKKLKVGDVITFLSNRISDDGRMVLNTHRIVEIRGEEGNATSFITKGDNNPGNDPGFVLVSDVVGVFQGKAGGVGKFVMFMGSTGGFLTFVLAPTLIIVIYAAVNLVLVIMKERKVQTAAAADAKAAERERMRAELLAEMGMAPAESATLEGAPAEETSSEPETAVEAEKPAGETSSEPETAAEAEKPAKPQTKKRTSKKNS